MIIIAILAAFAVGAVAGIVLAAIISARACEECGWRRSRMGQPVPVEWHIPGRGAIEP